MCITRSTSISGSSRIFKAALMKHGIGRGSIRKLKGDHDTSAHVVRTPCGPPNMFDDFASVDPPNLIRVGDVRQNVLNRHHNYGHKPLVLMYCSAIGPSLLIAARPADLGMLLIKPRSQSLGRLPCCSACLAVSNV